MPQGGAAPNARAHGVALRLQALTASDGTPCALPGAARAPDRP